MTSFLPVYNCMVKGTDLSDYDLFDKRTLRATTALPDSTYLRGATSIPLTLNQRSISVARDLLQEEPDLRARDYRDYWDIKKSINRSLYSSNIFDSPLGNSRNYSYKSSYGYTIPLYRRRYPSSYSWSYPSYPSYNYSYRPDDEVSYNYSRRDPYLSATRGPYRGQSRYPWRDWRTEYPYRSYSPNRPRHIWPTVRSSYLYPKYV